MGIGNVLSLINNAQLNDIANQLANGVGVQPSSVGLAEMKQDAIDAFNGTGTIPPDNSVTLKKLNSVVYDVYNIFDKGTAVAGTLYGYETGTVRSSATHKVSDYIPVDEGQVIYLSASITSGDGSTISSLYFNASHVKVSTISGTVTSITIPVGVKYVRFTIENAKVDTMMIRVGAQTAGTYYAYNTGEISNVGGDVADIINFHVNTSTEIQQIIDSRAISSVYDTEVWNMFDKSTAGNGQYLAWNGAATPISDAWLSDYIEVTEGETYRFNISFQAVGSTSSGYRKIYYNASHVIVADIEHEFGEFTVPTGQGIKYVRISDQVYIQGGTTTEDIQNVLDMLMMVHGTDLPSEYIAHSIKKVTFKDADYNLMVKEIIKAYAEASGNGSLQPKKWVTLGDSITAGTGKYHTYTAENLGNTTVHNMGVGGARYVTGTVELSCTTQLDTIPLDADIITIAMGTNDGSSPRGTMGGTTDTTTLYGACHVMFSGLITRFLGTAKIGVILPYAHTGSASNGTSDVIKEVAEYYGIPVLNLSKNTNGLNSHPVNTTYLPDSLHPTADAHRIFISPLITSFIKTFTDLYN